ncbi:MAG TPA: hypothetical protein DD663_04935 [Exiguobacterium sp.]|nr:hypothetical protein [Exiguobacterium sp.]
MFINPFIIDCSLDADLAHTIAIDTGPDADLIGRLDEFLDLFKVKSVYDPKIKHTTQAYKDFFCQMRQGAICRTGEGLYHE